MGKKTMSPKGDSIPHTHLNINNLNLSLTAMACPVGRDEVVKG